MCFCAADDRKKNSAALKQEAAVVFIKYEEEKTTSFLASPSHDDEFKTKEVNKESFEEGNERF